VGSDFDTLDPARRMIHDWRRAARVIGPWSRPCRCPSSSVGWSIRPREIEDAAAKLRCTAVR